MLTSALSITTRRSLVLTSIRSSPSTTRWIQTTRPQLNAQAAEPVEVKSRAAGSYHWNLERALSVALVPALGGAFIVGPHPMFDMALMVIVPLHCHLGLGCIVDDYLPKRKFGALHTLSKVGLGVGTALAIYGCYEFNTKDVGITAFIKQTWTGQK